MDERLPPFDVAVVKIGGSVLTSTIGYRRAAEYLATRVCERPGEKVLAIVSAQQGDTDRLLTAARDIVAEPAADTLDLLWSTGEVRSAAILALSLQALGVQAAAANVHQTGLTTASGRATTARVMSLRLRALLARADVVVAPGFLARSPGDGIASLGRGGSDLSAVLLAAGLGARACELLKDVPGFYDADPNLTSSAQHLASLDYATAICLAERGCALVQQRALEAARELDLPIVIRSLGDDRYTVVSDRVAYA